MASKQILQIGSALHYYE